MNARAAAAALSTIFVSGWCFIIEAPHHKFGVPGVFLVQLDAHFASKPLFVPNAEKVVILQVAKHPQGSSLTKDIFNPRF